MTQRDVEGVAEADEAGRLVGGVDVQHAGQHQGWLATIPTVWPVEAGEADHDVGGPVLLDLEEVGVVAHGPDDVAHVVGLVGLGRDDLLDVAARRAAAWAGRGRPSCGCSRG